MRLTKNFTKAEFESKDGAPMPLEVLQNIKTLAGQLQIIRDEIGKPITITSGYRSPQHNKAINGAKDSYHVRGMAADITAAGLSPIELRNVIKKLMDEGKIKAGGLKAYKSWVHYDYRGNYTSW
jgi:uncharacterized protein YcbK (DUF882 family)